MSWTISKEFNFEAGHRVHLQQLNNPEFSISTECACKHLHGHSYTIKVALSSDTLDHSGMVTDFKNVNFMKTFVDEVLDHKFILDINDPLFDRITGTSPAYISPINNFTNLGDIVGKDGYNEGFVLVNFCPTSENLCMYIKKYAQNVLGNFAKVQSLELWETKKSYCKYED